MTSSKPHLGRAVSARLLLGGGFYGEAWEEERFLVT